MSAKTPEGTVIHVRTWTEIILTILFKFHYKTFGLHQFKRKLKGLESYEIKLLNVDWL